MNLLVFAGLSGRVDEKETYEDVLQHLYITFSSITSGQMWPSITPTSLSDHRSTLELCALCGVLRFEKVAVEMLYGRTK